MCVIVDVTKRYDIKEDAVEWIGENFNTRGEHKPDSLQKNNRVKRKMSKKVKKRKKTNS